MEDELLSPLKGEKFTFLCHKDIQCFNECCGDLRMVLTPYDIIRIKKRLGIASEEFLNRYTEQELSDTTWFPMVKLKMNHKDKKCPFVTPEGCSIYEDRPGACRTYPLGRAASKPGGNKTQEEYFFVNEDYCQGYKEDKEWSIDQWKLDQGIEEYNHMNDLWTGLITHKAIQQGGVPREKQLQMFCMACYDIDTFRRFVFDSSFLNMFEIEGEVVEKIKKDDIALMKFALKWLRFSLFGEDTLTINSAVLKARKKAEANNNN